MIGETRTRRRFVVRHAIAYRVLSTVEVKEMRREKTILPLTDVQNHLLATARNERRGPYEQCHACHWTARIA
jgi:hypothetical protein